MANKSAIILYSEFDPSLINFDPIARNRRGGKICYLSYGPDKRRICLQTPVCATPFGVSVFEDEKTGEKSYSLDLSFKDLATDPKMKKFYDTMNKLNEVILGKAVERSQEWFDKTMSKDVLGEFYRPLVKLPKDPKYNPTMKVKIPMRDGTPQSDLYSENRDKVPMDYLLKGSTVKCLLEVRTVWFVNKNFGVTWQLAQGAVVSRPQKLVGYSFAPSDDDEVGNTGGYNFADDAPGDDF